MAKFGIVLTCKNLRAWYHNIKLRRNTPLTIFTVVARNARWTLTGVSVLIAASAVHAKRLPVRALFRRAKAGIGVVDVGGVAQAVALCMEEDTNTLFLFLNRKAYRR